MADVTFRIAEDNSKEILNKIERRAEAALEACGIQAQTYATQNVSKGVPRHPGSWYTPGGAHGLAGSIAYKVDKTENVVYVGTNNEHANYNEYGTGIYADNGKGRKSPWTYMGEDGNFHRTRGITPLHFLKNAVADHVQQYKDIIKKQLNK